MNQKVAHKVQPCVSLMFIPLITQNQGNMESICFLRNKEEKLVNGDIIYGLVLQYITSKN